MNILKYSPESILANITKNLQISKTLQNFIWCLWNYCQCGNCFLGTHYPYGTSVQFSLSVVSDSLQPHESQHARPPCPSQTPRVCSNSCPLSWWCHPAISSCHPLLLLPPIPPRIRVFSTESTLHMRWPKYWSFSFSISPSNEHPGLISFRMDWLWNLGASRRDT